MANAVFSGSCASFSANRAQALARAAFAAGALPRAAKCWASSAWNRASSRARLAQFFQRPCQRCGFGDDPRFAGAVGGERERLDQRGLCFALVTLLGINLRQLDVQVRDFAILQIVAQVGPHHEVSGMPRHGEAKAAEIPLGIGGGARPESDLEPLFSGCGGRRRCTLENCGVWFGVSRPNAPGGRIILVECARQGVIVPGKVGDTILDRQRAICTTARSLNGQVNFRQEKLAPPATGITLQPIIRDRFQPESGDGFPGKSGRSGCRCPDPDSFHSPGSNRRPAA